MKLFYFYFLLNIFFVAILLKTEFFCTFWRLKILVLWLKIVQNLLIFVYLFCPKNGTTDFTKTFITQEWLVIESCPTSHWIAFLMLYRLMYALILAWSAFREINNVDCPNMDTHLLSKKWIYSHICLFNLLVIKWLGERRLNETYIFPKVSCQKI